MRCLGIAERVKEEAANRIKNFPQHTNRASSLGHPCLRYLVLSRTKWQEKRPHDVGLQLIFDEGNLHEPNVIQKMQNAGIDVIRTQEALWWEEPKISGHIDGMVHDVDDKLIPLEIKTMSPFVYERLAHADDVVAAMMNGPWYHQQYPAQLLLYCLLEEKPRGTWVFKNKVNGDLSDVLVELDDHLDLAERIVKKAETVNDIIDNGKDLPPVHDEYTVCENCGYNHICIPDNIPQGQMEMDTELGYYLDLREELKVKIDPVSKELRMVEDEIKTRLKRYDSDHVLAMGWLGKKVTVTRKPQKGYEYSFYKWSKLEENNKAEN